MTREAPVAATDDGRAGRARARSVALLRDAGMTLLLAMLAATIVIVPVASHALGDATRAVLELFYVLALLAGAFAIAERRGVAALAIAAMAAAWLPLPWPEGVRRIAHQLASLSAIVLIATMVGIRVFGPGPITADRMMGAVALYLLLGLAWGNVYEIVAQLDAAAFSVPATGAHGVEPWFYFSFVTLTTVGYGDVTPLSAPARAIAITEALVGQLYPAIVLGRLVTLQAPPPPAP